MENNMDLSRFSTEELKEMYSHALENITKLIVNKEAVELISAIQKELDSRV